MNDRERTISGLTRRQFVAVSSASALAVKLGAASGSAAELSIDSPPNPTAVTFVVNGRRRTITVDNRVTLLDALRDHLGLTGAKKGCDQGTCGACTVLVNGRRIDACLSLAVMHAGDRVTTIEGIGENGALHPVQSAFVKHDGFQCGYCTSGQIVSAVGFLAEGHALDRQTISEQLSGNVCRCGCYPHIVDAVLEAAKRS